jgi:hypothetical protein
VRAERRAVARARRARRHHGGLGGRRGCALEGPRLGRVSGCAHAVRT